MLSKRVTNKYHGLNLLLLLEHWSDFDKWNRRQD